jgi:hypothetical protein
LLLLLAGLHSGPVPLLLARLHSGPVPLLLSGRLTLGLGLCDHRGSRDEQSRNARCENPHDASSCSSGQIGEFSKSETGNYH